MAQAHDVSETWQRAFEWIEASLGGKIVHAERQPRWRPAWFLDLQRDDGERLALYFRGDRGETDHGVYSLEREMRVFQLLEENGIPVPHVYGFCPEPRGIVMQRCPGRANLATARTRAERESVLDDYMEILARLHRIPLDVWQPLGIDAPDGPEQLGLADFDVWERAYRAHKVRPEPAIEYLIRWVRGHVPERRARASLICSDAGQFLFDNGQVTALLDLELATLGDPMADLGGMRGRDLSEPLGDLRRGFAQYERYSGQPLDREAIDFHTVRFCLVTPLAVAHLVAAPPPGIDFIQYLAWYCVWLRSPLEIIAARRGVSIDPVPVPDAVRTSHSAGHDALVAMLDAGDAADAFAGYERDAAARLAEYLRRAERLGPALDAQDQEEAESLLGQRFESGSERDAALESLVQAGAGARDEALLRYLHRRVQRLEVLIAPVMRELEGAKIQLLV